MIFNDFISILTWWLLFLFLGFTFLPLSSYLFSKFIDHGYIFAKVLGLLLISYLTWLLGSLHITPFSQWTIIGIFLVCSVINFLIIRKDNVFLKLKQEPKIIILEEILFTAGFFFWAYIRSFEPSIHGLEKFMDFGFVNSILRADYFPPKDIWLAPFSINYYYFGHLVTAVLIKASGVSSIVGYNLMLASLFAFTLAGSFSLGANLFNLFRSSSNKQYPTGYTLISGLLTGFLVTFSGNLHTIYIFFQTYTPAEKPTPFWQLPLSFNLTGYWYPNATRFIENTIHEFPIYSFVVSDLHGHVSNIPFVLLILALLITIYLSSSLNTIYYILYSLLIATSLMTNVLDGPIYLLAIFIILTTKKYLSSKSIKNAILRSGITTVFIMFGTIIFSLPFWLTFVPFGSGIGVICAPEFLTKLGHFGPFLFEVNHCARSPLWMLLILWGFPLFVVSMFVFYILKIPKFIENLKFKIINSVDILALTLSLTAFILITIPEFLYVKDIYPAHYRANTVFKFGYQAFIILGLTSGYFTLRLFSFFQKTNHYALRALPLAALLFLVAIYPYFAINSYYGSLRKSQGLDGLQYLNSSYPADYQAVLWLNNNILGQPVILEAQGDSYTDYARVSANTGLPTVVGWPVHEWLWRGSYDEAGKRSGEVTTLYTTGDLNLTKQMLGKYKVEYVFIGELERQKYPSLNEGKFKQLGKVVFQSGETKIYQLNF